MRAALALSFLVACGGGASTPVVDAAPVVDAPIGLTEELPALPDATPPITAPSETWTWVPLAGMTCADGSPTGVGVNLTDRSDRVMIYFQGGGACGDATTCFVTKTAVHIEGGFADADFQSDIATLTGS